MSTLFVKRPETDLLFKKKIFLYIIYAHSYGQDCTCPYFDITANSISFGLYFLTSICNSKNQMICLRCFPVESARLFSRSLGQAHCADGGDGGRRKSWRGFAADDVCFSCGLTSVMKEGAMRRCAI